MRINSDKLKSLATERGVSVEQLAASLPKSDRRKQAGLAEKKVRNWMAGSDHPRCTAADIAAMSGVLGVEPKTIARFTSSYRFARSSWRKADLVAELIRGRTVDEAEALLEFSPRRAAVFVRKALNAASQDAQNADAEQRKLVVTECRVDAAPTIKRFHPKDRGRAHPIAKRTSHIIVGVEEVG